MANEIDIKNIFKPTKILEVGKLRLHLEGCDVSQETFIEAVRQRKFESQRDVDIATEEYFRRLICACVKKVEGVTWQGQPWDVRFIDSTKREIDLFSYNFLIKILRQVLVSHQKDLQTEIINFYSDNAMALPEGVEIAIDDKKKGS